jgi:hypothetical protein
MSPLPPARSSHHRYQLKTLLPFFGDTEVMRLNRNMAVSYRKALAEKSRRRRTACTICSRRIRSPRVRSSPVTTSPYCKRACRGVKREPDRLAAADAHDQSLVDTTDLHLGERASALDGNVLVDVPSTLLLTSEEAGLCPPLPRLPRARVGLSVFVW